MAKRSFDILVSLIGLVVFSPVILGLAVLVKLDSPVPLRATRVSGVSEERSKSWPKTSLSQRV